MGNQTERPQDATAEAMAGTRTEMQEAQAQPAADPKPGDAAGEAGTDIGTQADGAQPDPDAEAKAAARQAFEEREAARIHALRGVNVAFNAVAAMAATLTWDQGRIGGLNDLATTAVLGLQQMLASASTVAAADQSGALVGGPEGDPQQDLAERYGLTLSALRDHHRQVGALIGLLELDVTNVPALVALERQVIESNARAAVMAQGLGAAITQTGIGR